MRMWNVNPKFLCNQHLLGEHVEMHMFVGTLNKGKSLRGFVRDGLVEIANIPTRHHELVNEMLRRGMNHKSPLPFAHLTREGNVSTIANIKELKKRCPKCKRRIERYHD